MVDNVRMLAAFCDSRRINMFVLKAKDNELKLAFCNEVLINYYRDHGYANPIGRTLRQISPAIYMINMNGETLAELYYRVATKGGREKLDEVQFFRDVPTAHSRNFYTVTAMQLAQDAAVVCVEEATAQVVAKQQQQYFSSFLEFSPDLCVISDIQSYSVEYINEAGVVLAKIPPNVMRDLLRVKMHDLFPDVRPQLESFKEHARREKHVQTKQIWTGRTTLTAMDGEKIEVDASLVFFREADSVSYVAILARDLRSVLKSAAELVEAKRANEAKSSFVSSAFRRSSFPFRCSLPSFSRHEPRNQNTVERYPWLHTADANTSKPLCGAAGLSHGYFQLRRGPSYNHQ